MKKKLYSFLVLIFCVFSIYANNPTVKNESWQILQKAQQEFDKNNFALSMKLAQEAVITRKNESENESKILTNAVTPFPVRKVGDFIPDVINVLQERQEYNAIKIINEWIGKYSLDYFDNSLAKLRSYIDVHKEYPEADFLIAKIYRIEGEFDIAQNYLEKAKQNSFLLEIPQQENDILFLIADIAELKLDFSTQEKALLLIAKNNGRFNDSTLKNAIVRTSKSVKEDNTSRFFKLYRIDAIECINAYFKLSSIYFNSKKYEDAYITNLYGVLIGFTHLNSLIMERESDYEFDSLENFFNQIARFDDIKSWCNENNFWESFYNIYQFGIKCGYKRFPKDMLRVVAQSCPETYWKNACQNTLDELTN